MKHFIILAACALIGASTPAFAQAPASALAPVAPEFQSVPEARLPKPVLVPAGLCLYQEITNGVTQSCARKIYYVLATESYFGGSEKAILAAASGFSPLNPRYVASVRVGN